MNDLKIPLRELQRDMQRHLLGEASGVTAAIVDAPPLPAADRLAIYRNAYRVRLIDALHDVLVRQHIAVRCHNDAGARTTTALARRVARGRIAANVDTHDRRADEIDRANDRLRIGVERVV